MTNFVSLVHYLPTDSLPVYLAWRYGPQVLESVLIFLGVLWLAKVLPSLGRSGKGRVCALIAANLIAVLIGKWVVASCEMMLGDMPSKILWLVTGTLAATLRAALVICAAIFLAVVGSRIGRKPLGIIAACGLIPSVLLALTDAALWMLNGIGDLLVARDWWRFPEVAFEIDRLNSVLLAFFWGTVAMFAWIIAMRQRG